MNNQDITCLYPKCEFKNYSRGLCRRHYATALRAVRSKITTWSTLQSAGKILPPARRGTGQPTEFDSWLLEVKEKEQTTNQ